MRMAIMFGVFAGAVVVLAGCTGDEPVRSGGAPVTSLTSAAAAPTTTVPHSATPAPSQWAMPNLVGSNLQAAQDQIQKLTGNPLFLTLSHDATGQGRQQILDRDWKVCAQNVAPGTPFSTDTTIDFGAVKSVEKCP